MTDLHHVRLLDGAQKRLASLDDISKIKAIRDQAEALRQHAKAARLGLKLQNKAAEIKLLAERKAGHLLAALGLRGGDRKTADRSTVSLEQLGISRKQSERWQREASVSKAAFQAYLRSVKQLGEPLTSAGLLRLAQPNSQAIDAEGLASFQELAEILATLARQGKSFPCVYADPPWAASVPCRNRTVRQLLAALKKVPVKAVSERNAHLHLWTPPGLFLEAVEVMKAWGFQYASHVAIATGTGRRGRYWQPDHGLLVLGVKGNRPFRDTRLPSILDGQPLLRPARPAFLRALIERVSPPPYLDLFGSDSEPGWTFASPEPTKTQTDLPRGGRST
jgi:N6-adenosine-specific RNA methylase IME4